MKKTILLVAILVFVLNAQTKAQQIHQLTQYLTNDFAFNPAVAGSSPYFVSKASFRKQWLGLQGSPTTGVLSLHTKFNEKNMGVGALLYTDQTGATSRFGFQLAYAYQIPLEEDRTYLGLGVAGALLAQGVDFSKLTAKDAIDAQLANTAQSKMGFDSHLGAYLKSENYWAGISVNQLLASKFKFFDDQASIQNARHLYLTGGYTFNATEKVAIEPSVLFKMATGYKPQIDLNARAWYNKQYWLGLGYRTSDAIAILAGIQLNSGINAAVSYDITTSGLNQVSNGSLEFTLGYNFGGKFNTNSNTVVSPRSE